MFVACGPAAKLRRAEKLIKKAEEQGAVWHVDTVRVKVPVFITETKTDTTFVSEPGDTVVLEKERLKIKYVRMPGDTVYIEGACEADTVYREVPITITKTIEAKSGFPWWWLVVAVLAGAGIVAIFKR